MILHPDIVSVTELEQGFELNLRIPEKLFYFEGHFPNSPILPGITQLHWAVEYIKSYFKEYDLVFERVEVLKFQVITVPGQLIKLTLEKSPKKENQYSFAYSSERGNHSSGRLVFTS